MRNFILSEMELKALRAAHRLHRDKRSAYRINAVYLLGSGWKQQEVCEALLLDENTLTSYVRRYQEGSIEGLLTDDYVGGKAKLSDEELTQLDVHLQEKVYLNSKKVAAYIKKRFGKVYGIRAVASLLHRLGYVYKKPKRGPAKSNRQAQEEFIERYKCLKRKLKEDEKILYMDTTHPQHNGVAAYGWIKKGKEKKIKSSGSRQHLNIHGALDIESCKVTVRFEERLTAEAVEEMLRKIRKSYPQSGKIFLICDNATYYKAKRVKKEAKRQNIELAYLPPNSPNLNIIERLWKYFRKRLMYNQYYEKFSEFKEAAENFFKTLRQFKSELRTLLTNNFQLFETT